MLQVPPRSRGMNSGGVFGRGAAASAGALTIAAAAATKPRLSIMSSPERTQLGRSACSPQLVHADVTDGQEVKSQFRAISGAMRNSDLRVVEVRMSASDPLRTFAAPI